MKKNIQILIIAIAAIVGLTFNSCKKDPIETPAPLTGTMFLHLHTNVDTSEVSYGTVYTMSDGRKISVTKAQLYITDIHLIKLDGSTYDGLAGVTILKKQETEEYTLGTVPAGNYKSIEFKVGLTSATNASIPAAGDSTLNQPPMWFGATAQPSGFVFVNFQGTIDTTVSATGSIAQMQPFSYKIGTDANLKSVTMPAQNYNVAPNQAQFIHLMIDYSKLFTGITLNVNSNLTMNTTAANTTPLGTQLTNNIPLMFRYEY